MAFDPLSGQGVYRALESGMMAAHAVRWALEGDQQKLAEYSVWVGTTYERSG